MGPIWVLSAPDRPHVGPVNLAIRDGYVWCINSAYDRVIYDESYKICKRMWYALFSCDCIIGSLRFIHPYILFNVSSLALELSYDCLVSEVEVSLQPLLLRVSSDFVKPPLELGSGWVITFLRKHHCTTGRVITSHISKIAPKVHLKSLILNRNRKRHSANRARNTWNHLYHMDSYEVFMYLGCVHASHNYWWIYKSKPAMKYKRAHKW